MRLYYKILPADWLLLKINNLHAARLRSLGLRAINECSEIKPRAEIAP